MKKFFGLLLFIVLLSCNNNHNELQGLWERSPNSDWWIQINKDHTFEYGWKSQIRASGKYDLKDNIINLRTEDEKFKSKKYRYKSGNDSLYLYELNGEIDEIYVKSNFNH